MAKSKAWPGTAGPIMQDGVLVLRCSACELFKPTAEFFRNAAQGARGFHNYCKPCTKAYEERRYPHGKPATRSRYLRKTYGLTEAEFDAMAAPQDGKCAICGNAPEVLVVDHDHRCCPGDRSCGACIRGLLCHPCNRCLGLLGDDVSIVLAALNYLTADRGTYDADSGQPGELCG